MIGKCISAARSVIGKIFASAELYRARLKTCESCEHRKDTRCQVCGCNVNLKASVIWESCPKQKW